MTQGYHVEHGRLIGILNMTTGRYLHEDALTMAAIVSVVTCALCSLVPTLAISYITFACLLINDGLGLV